MRILTLTSEFEEFYESLPFKVKAKIDYVISCLADISVVNTKFVKKLVGTKYYELRVSVGNEYRVILLSIDNDNIIEAEQVTLLNGFIKKSTSDYKRQIGIADKILLKYEKND